MQFHYIASQLDGKLIENDIEAKDIGEVLAYLSGKSLKPVSVKPINKERLGFSLNFLKRGITLTDQIFISKYLSLMLKIGTGLLEAINILMADFSKSAVKAFLLEIRSSLEQGNPFYSTFAKYPKVFSPVYTNLIKAGEASGNLEKTFEELTEMLDKQKTLRDQVRSALVYPVLLLIGSCAILAFIVTFALPKIAKVFADAGFNPPGFSKAVFAVGFFLNDYGLYILGAVIVGGIFAWRLYKQTFVFKKFLLAIVGEIPVVHDVIKKIALQRFASVLSTLIRAGIPITEALGITANAVNNENLREALLRISDEGLAKGLTIGEAFRREAFFPMTVINLVGISEKAGHLSEVLTTLADFYAKEIDSSVKTLVSFLEPLLLLAIGSVIGLIALSIIVPIYQLTAQF